MTDVFQELSTIVYSNVIIFMHTINLKSLLKIKGTLHQEPPPQ